jgi:hypothetical protein
MKKFMMKKMMPMMSGTIESMEFTEKEEMMGSMMPHMMANMSTEEKMKMMQKMMPMMMADMDISQMDTMMETMMPLMMEQMKAKGISAVDMMQKMCPRCISLASSNASEEEKEILKTDVQKVFTKI